ncbi:hypothetical protein HYV79_03320 [Candidatus Woesearchaeota archaeon]|nr:hypothetical protein [Candidatus Woesearchaeota archaeon]
MRRKIKENIYFCIFAAVSATFMPLITISISEYFTKNKSIDKMLILPKLSAEFVKNKGLEYKAEGLDWHDAIKESIPDVEEQLKKAGYSEYEYHVIYDEIFNDNRTERFGEYYER